MLKIAYYLLIGGWISFVVYWVYTLFLSPFKHIKITECGAVIAFIGIINVIVAIILKEKIDEEKKDKKDKKGFSS